MCLAYVVAVAVAAFYWQFVLFKPQGLIVALFASSWMVPALNALWPEARFAWNVPRQCTQALVNVEPARKLTPRNLKIQSRRHPK